MPLFQPTAMFRRAYDITPAWLRSHGICALILDVDNTLTAHGSQQLPPEIGAWLCEMRGAGIALTIASNNVEKRVAPFAARLGLPFQAFCCKPSPFGLWKAQRALGFEKRRVALVGDQLFTDVLGANAAGLPILLVEPMQDDAVWTIRLKRALEKPFLTRYFKHGGVMIQKEDEL